MSSWMLTHPLQQRALTDAKVLLMLDSGDARAQVTLLMGHKHKTLILWL